MEKELRNKLALEIATNLKNRFKEMSPAAFDKMEKHIEEAARTLAKRFMKVKQKLNEKAEGTARKPSQPSVAVTTAAKEKNEKPAKTPKKLPAKNKVVKSPAKAAVKKAAVKTAKKAAPKKAAKSKSARATGTAVQKRKPAKRAK